MATIFHASKITKSQSSRASASVRAPLQLERSKIGRFCGLCWPPGSIFRVALLIIWTYQASEVCWLRGGEFSSASDSDLHISALSCRSSFVSDLSIPCRAFPHPDMSNTHRLGTWKRSLGPLKLRHLNALLSSVAMQHLTVNWIQTDAVWKMIHCWPPSSLVVCLFQLFSILVWSISVASTHLYGWNVPGTIAAGGCCCCCWCCCWWWCWCVLAPWSAESAVLCHVFFVLFLFFFVSGFVTCILFCFFLFLFCFWFFKVFFLFVFVLFFFCFIYLFCYPQWLPEFFS